MTTRSLWQNIMHYGAFDRTPVVHWWQWDETLARWRQEGLPAGADLRQYLHAEPHWTFVGVNLDLYPGFPREVRAETAEYRIVRGYDGVVQQEWKNQSCIPHFLEFSLRSAADWPVFKKQLQPDPARVPADLQARIDQAEKSGLPITVPTASLMGWVRNWMGVENLAYLVHDDPDCYADMVKTLADLTCWGLDQVLPHLSSPADMAFGWEDICGKSGPLVSPTVFERCVAPGYRQVRAKLDQYHVPLLGVDSDGLVEPLIPYWLEAGVNVQFPIEIGTWHADPYQIRQRFGKVLRIIGGFDKLALEKGPAAIDAELARRLPLMKEGGFILMPDHLITPGTSLANYQYFLNRLRELRF